GDRLTEWFHTPRDWVLVMFGIDRINRSLLDCSRSGKIGKSLCQIDGTVPDCEPRHLTDDGFLKMKGASALEPSRRSYWRHEVMLSCRITFLCGLLCGGL